MVKRISLLFKMSQVIPTLSKEALIFKNVEGCRDGSAKNCTEMKSTKVQTLGAVALHATTVCTNDTSINHCHSIGS